MNETIKELATQTPALVVLGFIVYAFLKHSSQRDLLIKQMHDEHLDARVLTREALRDNTNVLKGNTEAIRELCKAVEKNKQP